jgi:hypothetical protein
VSCILCIPSTWMTTKEAMRHWIDLKGQRNWVSKRLKLQTKTILTWNDFAQLWSRKSLR